MNTSKLKQFAQNARRQLIDLVATKLSIVLDTNSAARREREKAVKDLEKKISRTSRDQVIEKVAYIWFNRFCALRFMDANRYTAMGVVSPARGFSQPEILMEAKQGHIDDGLRIDQEKVFGLLNETIPSPEPQQEAYRMLLVAVCNDYNSIMPFLFEKIADFTELLMPDDLLSDSSILTATREALSEEACADVEVIGWLYQFYISEKKDEVFAGLKKNKKVTPEDIPAATQLFTPNWIVRYLVENSLGRLWILNHPDSRLVDKMAYYIKPEQEETDFLVIKSPEEIKICDPACGSGHMLVYAFEILYAVYEEQGYDAPQIPQLILENNLYGIEIDERAGELAAFALFMKAREKYRRFFKKNVQPNICVLENVSFKEHEVKSYMDAVAPDLFTMDLSTLLYQFEEADNFGSLIRPELTNIPDVLRLLDEKKVSDDMFLQDIHERVLKVLSQANYLSPKYHVVITNPPYMGKGMNGRLGKWVKDNYPQSKTDLFAVFIERSLKMVMKQGIVSMITMQSWMFLSSYEKLRKQILGKNTVLSMAHLGPRAFNSIGGEVVSTTAFVLNKNYLNKFPGVYLRLVDGISEEEKNEMMIDAIVNNTPKVFYHVSTSDFKKVPGSPIAYWVDESILDTFNEPTLGNNIITEGQNKTANNNKYVRNHWEVNRKHIGRDRKWLLYSKGGAYRKWFGNLEHVVDWSEEARMHYRKDSSCRIIAEEFWYKDGITWTDITSGGTGFRYLPKNTTFDMSGPTAFFKDLKQIYKYLCLLNSNYTKNLLPILNPTLHAQLRDIKSIPKLKKVTDNSKLQEISKSCIDESRNDWNSYEPAWDFLASPMILHARNIEGRYKEQFDRTLISHNIGEIFEELKAKWLTRTIHLKQLEEENNKIVIEIYDLQKELVSDLSFSEITLNCNPHYRYGSQKTSEELEALLLSDTIRELISYSVGCIFGRYSLDSDGLILANQGETLENYLVKIPEPTFIPDNDNVIPIMDVDWFTDDIAERFKKFLKVTFGEEHYTENLEFIEKAIGKDIRKFFLKDFYTYHVKMYKKRPIYWMFSSPKGSFNALIYMHRYRPDTVSIILNDYLREFRTKLAARKDNLENISISTSASQGEKTKALKEIEKIKKVLDEVNEYERDILYPLATKQIEIDLDDGVKVNYPKFGKALKKIAGLS
ncbi:BREX-1 system adenine-specific DNA-methyltransferase PglX [Desulfobacula phenolica]|uniref:site-specific DNA-methyltransferase (adenine-specific) n=1 Tax=Desulfobacula phenolica TaxID=90732 RepID=A0A1H2DPV7_9BACT|nr:BREX-1 system adenine-specific DNA-methyltransferase PglX [Desulfobacula phenolica]SDT84905.1 Type II restriction/modification system, DNA methylase subunit YeeA [Desulfobacula phenolica]